MFQDTPSFLTYWRNACAHTVRVLEALQPEDLEWAPAPGAFTFGDLFRHRLGLERWMVAKAVRDRPSRYAGHGVEHTGGLASGLAGVRACLDQGHAESLAIFATLFGLTEAQLAAASKAKTE